MTFDQAVDRYNRRIKILREKELKAKQKKAEKDQEIRDKQDNDAYKLQVGLDLFNISSRVRQTPLERKLLYDTYVEGGIHKPKWRGRKGGDYGFLWPGGEKSTTEKLKEEAGKSLKKLVSPLEEHEGYTQFKSDKEASELSLEEVRESGSAVIDYSYDPALQTTGEDLYAGEKYDPSQVDVSIETPTLKEDTMVDRTRYIRDMVDPLSDVDLDVSPEGAPDIMMESPQLKGAEGAPISVAPDIADTGVDVPEEKEFFLEQQPSKMEQMQNVYQMYNIGQTILDDEATGVQKGVATVQASKLLADIATKKAKEKTVGQLGSKALGDVWAKKGLQEGVKLTGKQAVGAAAGGALGGYTMVTEGAGAAEAWAEEDYDEAIFRGVGAVSGGLQAAGAGMMLTGIGAPLGLVLYGAGTAGSVISSTATFLEELLEGKKAQAGPEAKQTPSFDYGAYRRRIRERDPSSRYYRR